MHELAQWNSPETTTQGALHQATCLPNSRTKLGFLKLEGSNSGGVNKHAIAVYLWVS